MRHIADGSHPHARTATPAHPAASLIVTVRGEHA